MKRKNLLLTCASMGMFVTGMPTAASAQAQSGTDMADAVDTVAQAEASAQAITEGDIVVTALKRDQRLQDIPASISAVSGEALSDRGITNVRDLTRAVPNLVWGEYVGTTLITIRGVGSNVETGVTEPTVALYVDGVALPRPTMAAVRAVDLERVEVLRGPQGTLYGRNATGGAINFISARPSRSFDAKVELSTGSRDAWGIDGYVSVPLSDGFYVRVSGGREKQDGYVRVLNTGQRLNGVDAVYGRIAALIEPTSNLSLDLSLRYEKNSAPVAYQQQQSPSAIDPSPGGSINEPNKIIANVRFGSRRETLVASGALAWTVSDTLTVKSLTGYIDHRSHDRYDADNTIQPFYFTSDFDRPSKSFSQEVSLVGSMADLDFIIGGYYFKEDYKGTLPVDLEALGAAAFGVPDGAQIFLRQTAKINNFALFADVTYGFNDALRLNVGLRLNHEDSDYGQVFAISPVVPPSTQTYKIKRTRLLPKVALQYDFAPDVNGYAQWTRGYKSGGGNLPSGSGDFLPLYQPESLDAFEVGLKSQLFGRRITANVAAFYYDYSDLQVTVALPPSSTVVQNANARLYGIEGDFRFNVSDQLTLTVAPTWMHGRFKDFVTTDPTFGNVANLDGSPLPRAPDFSVNGGVETRFDLGGQLLSRLQLSASVRYNSTTVLRYFNRNALERQAGYALVDLSGTITDVGERTRLSLFLNNVFDKTYKQQAINFGIGYMGNYGQPRTFGVRLSRRFN
jgi:iron complex outermembrane receptor protein